MRRRRQQTVTLFAFQDIITGVAGVMLFILLLLVVQLTVQATAAVAEKSNAPSKTNVSPLSESTPLDRPFAVAELELEELQRKLQQLQAENAALLEASDNNITRQIAKAKAELDELLQEAKKAKEDATSIASEIKNQEVSPEKKAVLQRREELRQRLQALREERTLHEHGKLVTFNVSNRNRKGMWVIDTTDVQARLFDVSAPDATTLVSYDRETEPMQIVQKIRGGLAESTRSRSVILVLRPSVAGIGSQLIAGFRSGGFTVALELLDEDTVITKPSLEEQAENVGGKLQ